MRSGYLFTTFLVVALLSILSAYAQEDGDAVTYTRNDVIYTGIIDGNLDTVSTSAISTELVATETVAVTATETAVSDEEDDDNNNAIDLDPSPSSPASQYEPLEDPPSRLLLFQSLQRRHFDASPTPLPLLKRQQQQSPGSHLRGGRIGGAADRGGAALGGGGGTITSATGLQTISGYTPPDATQAPTPTNQISGTIISASEIPGYTGAVNEDGVSSGSGRLEVANIAVIANYVLGAVGGAVFVALL